MKKFVCSVCGYVYEGEAAPEKCPICGAPASKFVEQSGEQECTEGCLSSPGQYGITKRPAKVKVRAFNRRGEVVEVEGEGLLATACCHEIDHLNGILFKSHVIRMLDPKELDGE